MKATYPQLSKIHVLLTQLGLMDEKILFVSTFSNGRVSSSKDLTMEEAGQLIKHLSQMDPNERMRGKIFALAYDAGIIYGHTLEDKKMNGIKLNRFLNERGTVKKDLNKLNKAELIKTVSQFKQLLKHQEESKMNKATSEMLSGLNISTLKK